MEHWVEGAVLASKTFDAGQLDVIGKHIERRTGNMIMDPVNRTSIAHTRVSLQVVNPHTSGWPGWDSRIAIVHPDFAPLVACGRQMYGDYECFFRGNGSGLLGEPALGG